jgi:hypothetical protein
MFTYACCDYPGMEAGPGRFEAASEVELWAHIEMHATVAHKEDPLAWTEADISQVMGLIKAAD